MDWRIDSAAPVTAADLKSHLETQAVAFIKASCPPVQEDVSGGLMAPRFVEAPEAGEVRKEISTAISALCSLAQGVEASRPGAKYLATFSDVLTVDGCRRINLSIEEAPPEKPEEPVVDVTTGAPSSLMAGA